MEKFVRSYKDLSAPKGTRKKKRTFWYINYLHFVKLILLRMHFMRKVCMETQEEMLTADITYRCDECSTEYDLATAMMHVRDDHFYCERCFRDRDEINRLREVEQASSSGAGASAGGDRGSKKRRLNEKREEQMAEAPGLRDGIFELLHKIKTFPIAPPQNLPNDHIENDRADQEELEAKGEEADAQGRRGGGGGGGGGGGQHTSFVNESGQSVQVKIISGGSKAPSRAMRSRTRKSALPSAPRCRSPSPPRRKPRWPAEAPRRSSRPRWRPRRARARAQLMALPPRAKTHPGSSPRARASCEPRPRRTSTRARRS